MKSRIGIGLWFIAGMCSRYIYLQCNRRWAIIVVALLFAACNNGGKSSSSSEEGFLSCPHFSLKVSNRIDVEEYGILKPQLIERKDGLYIIYNDAMKQASYSVSKRGDSLYISNKTDLSREGERVIFASSQNTAIAVSGYFSGCWAKYTSSDGHEFIIPYPEIESIIELTDHEKSALLMNTNVAMSPDAKHMALSTTNGCVLAIYDCSPNGVKKVSFKVYDEPLFVVSQQSVAATTDSPVGFGDIFAGDKNLYCLYEKGTMGDLLKGHQSNTCLLVFNWKGELLKNYYLEKPLNTFGVDEERGILYGIGNDPEGCIFEYKL